MADYSPTIIAASLNDKELQESINKLVKHVEEGTKKMSTAMTNAVEEMKKQLQSLGNINVNMGSASDGGSSRRKKKQEEETQAVKETTVAYDKLAEAQQKAVGGHSARESYITFMKGTGLNELISQEESRLLDQQIEHVNGLKKAIDRVKEAIKEAEQTSDPNRGKTIEQYRQGIQALENEIRKANETPLLGLDTKRLEELRKMRENIISVMRGEVTTQKQSTQAIDENAAAQARVAAQTELVANRNRELHPEIKRNGQVAQESAREIMRSMHEQLSLNTETPIGRLKELSDAVMKMQTAYYDMSIADRESPIGRSLKEDIENANKAITIVQKYNKELFAMQQGEGGKITSISSLESLKRSLKDLTDQYNRLTVAEIDAGKDTGIRQKYQEISRAAQILQRNLSRPVSFEAAMGLDEGTLDNIAYKIRQLQAYKQGIDLTKPTAAQEIKDVDEAITKLEKDMQKYTSQSKSVLDSNNALARSWNYMKNRLAFYFTVGASTAFVKNLIEVRSQYEMNERALGILINSAERGTQIFKELSEMALVSPYTLIELSSATKQLVAYGVAAKDAVDTTRRLADMAAAVGIPMERLTYALGQIKAYGYLNSRDQRMFANAGIPLVQELAKHYTELEGRLVTSADVYDRIKKKAVEYGDVVQVINKMTDEGGKFFDYQAKMAETLKVQLANLTLAWNNMLNEIGADTQGMISFGIKGLKQAFLQWRVLDEAIKNAAWTIGFFKSLQFVVLLFGGALKTSAGWTLLLGKRITELAISFGKAFGALAMNPMTWVVTAVYSIISLIRHINQVEEAAREMNRELAKNAKEAADSLDKYLGSESSKTNRAAAKNKSLSELDATKAFEDLRAQIELSSDNANILIANLLKIGDANERLSAAFDIADKIKEATSLLSGLNEEAFKVSQDSWLNGAFGEGLAEDLEDYVPQVMGKPTWLAKILFGDKKMIDTHDKDEAMREMVNLADDVASAIKERLGARISDPTILNESIERFRKIIKEKNPQIRGEIESWFDVEFDMLLADRFDKASATTSLSNQLLRVLKRDFASAFANLTDDILKDTATWDKAQIDAIKRAADELKKTTIPAWHSTIDEMVKYMNSQDWRIRIATEMGIVDRTDLQEEWDERTKLFNEEERRRLQAYKPKSGDTLSKWADEQRKAIQDLDKDINAYEADNSKFSKEQIKRINEEKKARQDALDVFNQSKATKDDIKAQKQAESELARTLKEELSLIDKVRSNYKKLTKEGVDAATALSTATSGFDETVSRINALLGKYGIGQIDLTKYAGVSNPKAIMEMLQAQLDALSRSGLAKTSEIKDLQVKLQDLKVESLTFDQQTLTQSLNNELGKLKDEYELAVELDANPELGGVFADMMGLSKEELDKLPRDFEGVVRRLQTIVDKQLGMGAFDVRSNLNKEVFDKWVKSSEIAQDSDKVKALKAITDYANKVRQDETKKQIEEWNKLLEKYAEYEYKRNQILQAYERERKIALKKGATQEVLDAIVQRKDRELAGLDLEQFQKTSTWLTATGDLVTLTDSALGLLIDRLEEYKKSAKDLDPKQIKQINNALKSLRREQRQGNPFLAIANAKDAAKETWDTYQNEIDEYVEKLKKLNELEEKNGELTLEQEHTRNDLIGTIAKLRNEQEKAGKVSVKSLTEGISGMAGAISQASNLLAGFFTQIGNSEAAENLKALSETLDKASQGAQIGSSFGKYGALIGGAIGLLTGLFSGWADEWSGNAYITEKVKESEKQIRRLEEAYKDLEFAAEQAYGVETLGAQESIAANKKLQLEELQRQLMLEESRKEKYKDEDRIEDLKSKIHDLQLEISRSTKEIVQDLLGISSYGDAITQLVQVMIDAFRNGEDAMAAFGEKWDEMIDNMILKLIVSTFMQKEWDEIMKILEQKKDEFLAQSTKDYESANTELGIISKMTNDEIAKRIAEQLGYSKISSGYKPEIDEKMKRGSLGVYEPMSMQSPLIWYIEAWQQVTDEEIEAYRKMIEQQIANAEKAGDGAEEAYTRWAIDFLGENGEGRKRMEDKFKLLEESLGSWYTFGENAEGQALNNLQQGISAITEDTAGALEAMLNGISQQIYLHSSQLEEIKTLMQGWNFDVSLGTMSQVLLQLQSSYQVQMTIQNTLLGWSSSNGMSVRVEMV